MKKIILALVVASIVCFTLAMTAFAASTNEFGAVETVGGIDLSKMSTDTSARVVLFDGTEYHTYPANYIVTSSTDLGVNFTYLNKATGKSYGVSSIIRIEIPTTVKVFKTSINGNQGGKNIVEVSFPEGTQITEMVWGALMNCIKLEKIEIPASVVTIGQDAFSNCPALTSVTFAENSNLKTIGPGCFGSCKLLTEFVVPNTVETISKSAFYNCTGLKKLVLGANTTVCGGALIGAFGYGDNDAYIEFYMNGSFATGEGSLESGSLMGRGNDRDLKNYVIFFTGTREQALALVNKYNTDVNLKDVNIVAYDPLKASGRDYLGMDAYASDIAVNTNRVLVYGYGVCDAFYEGEHQMAGTLEMQFVSYFEDVTFGDVCTRQGCGKSVIDESQTIGAMFEYLGYSCTESSIGGVYSMSQFYKINNENIEKYTGKTGEDFVYGIVVSSIESPLTNPQATSANRIVAEQRFVAHDYVSVKISGITDATANAGVVFCVYVIDGGEAFYLDGGETKSVVSGISYNSVSKMK